MAHINDFIDGTLVRVCPKETPSLNPDMPFLTTEFAKGTVLRIEREGQRIRILTDNDDLSICVTESKLTIKPEEDGTHSLKQGYLIIASYLLYKPKQFLPDTMAKLEKRFWTYE